MAKGLYPKVCSLIDKAEDLQRRFSLDGFRLIRTWINQVFSHLADEPLTPCR